MALKHAPEPLGYELFGPKPHYPNMPQDEFQSRLIKAQKLMAERDIDLLMLWSRQNCRYFAGFSSVHWQIPSIQPMVALFPQKGDPVLITPSFFRWTAEAQCWCRDIRGQDQSHDTKSERALPIEVAETVKEMGLGNGKIALEMGHLGHTWIPRPLNDIQTLMNNLPEATFVDGDEVIWGCRMIKSPLEIDLIRKAGSILTKAYAAVVNEYRPGMTEQDLSRIFMVTAVENGSEWVLPGHISCGLDKEGMFDIGSHFREVQIDKNTNLSIDMIARYKGYWADMGRVLNAGPVSDSVKKGHDLLWKSFDAGCAVAGPGVPASAVFREVTAVLIEGLMFANEMCGHGIGLDVHEPPVFSESEEMVLQPGMVMCLEPNGALEGFRRDGGAGTFQYENMLVITEDGCEVIHGLPRDIIQVTHPIV